MKENITENIKVLTVFSIIHFIVDFSCIYIVYNLFLDNSVDYKLKISMLIIYNFFAFFMQAPFGIIIDKLGGSFKYSALGCIFIFLSVFFAKYKIISVMILGIGNALFHLGGGVEILNRAERKATMPGIFVSTGAFGLFLGANVNTIVANITGVGLNGARPEIIIYLVLLLSAAVLFFLGANETSVGANENLVGANEEQVGAKLCEPSHCRGERLPEPARTNVGVNEEQVGANEEQVGANVYGARTAVGANENPVGANVYGARTHGALNICVAILILCVIIRSFVGMISIYPWKNIFVYALSLTLATVLGKFFGGILSDKFTAKVTTFVSLFLSASLYIFAANYPIAGILATFLFNITMPITLIYISNIMDEQKGFAFGLTTFGLFFGYLPVAINMIDASMFIKYIPLIVLLQNILLVLIIFVIDKKNSATA